jgi:glycosyltransferase involved in cell wall biosynthesis
MLANASIASDRRAPSPPVLRLAALATHPIQYHAPLHRALAAMPNVELTVYFAHRPSPVEQGIGFGIAFSWDDDLLAGYRSVWLRNEADARRAEAGAPFRDRYSDYDTPEISDIIAKEKFDAVLLHGWRVRSDRQALRACRAVGVPTIVRGDSQLRNDALPKRYLKRLVYRGLIRQFAVCLAVGERNEAYLRYYGATRIVRSTHFVDNVVFAQRAATALRHRDVRRASWGIAPGALVVLFVGKLVAWKRPLDLVRAVRRLPGVHILYVGDGPLRGDCLASARRVGVPVTCTGFLNQSMIAEAYTASDVLVLPSGSGRETWGLVVNEAMACARPAIVSEEAGCVPDLIREGETGFSYPAGDLAQLRRRIEWFLEKRDAAERLGASAREHVARFTPEAAARGVVEGANVATGRVPWA